MIGIKYGCFRLGSVWNNVQESRINLKSRKKQDRFIGVDVD